MKRKRLSRREFLKASAQAAAGMMTVSLLGCSGGGGVGGVAPVTSAGQSWRYRGARSITAVYQPANATLYRQLLPGNFQMPDSLQLYLAIVSYYDVSSPLVPYREGYAMLACKYRGQDAVYTLTMPVTDAVANAAGISLGFPKYVAEGIELTVSGGLWRGEVRNGGRSMMGITFTPGSGPVTLSRSNPGPTCVNLNPPGVGPEVLTVNTRGQQLVGTTTGTVAVTVNSGESWAPLLNGAVLLGAQLDEITGDWTLVGGSELNSAVVSIARIRNGRIDLAVAEAIDLLGGMAAVTAGRQRIMIKPNLVSDSVSSTTKPGVVRALVSLMQGAGKDVSIGEGSAACNNYNILNRVVCRTRNQDLLNRMQQHVFDALGYSALAADLGVPLVNLHTGDMVDVPVPGGFAYDSITIHRTLADTDLLCSVPMMKTHVLGGVTLGMKNLIGTYPGATYGSVRSLMHDRAAAVERSGVAAAVIDIVRANKLGLVVIDASSAMEGDGPENGTLVDMNLIVAGTNPLATDMVGAGIMGFQPSEIPTFQWAATAGMVPGAITEIEVRGESIANVRQNFVRPQMIPWSTARPTFGFQEI